MHIAEEKCCPVGYKRIEALKLDPLILIMLSLASRPFVHHLTTSIWQFYTCGAAFTPSVAAIATAHTNANISMPELPGTPSTESDAPCLSLSPQ